VLDDKQDSFGMLLSFKSRIYRAQPDFLEQSKQYGRSINNNGNPCRKYSSDPLSVTLYQHFRALLFKKKINNKIKLPCLQLSLPKRTIFQRI